MSMKLIIAVVNSDDASSVLNGLSRAGYSATKLSTTGSFLRAGNITLLIGVEEEKVDEVIALIGEHSSSRKQMTVPAPAGGVEGRLIAMPVEITVGGATVFVVDVEKFVKL